MSGSHPLLSVDGIEIRASRGGESHGLYRADEQTLLTLRCIGARSEPPPLILVHRRAMRGQFDRLADEFEERWKQATPLQTREGLHEVKFEPSAEPDAGFDPSPPPTPTAPDADAPRRWPGRRP